MRSLIKRSIGAGLENDPDDIRIVRGTLKALAGEEIDPEKLSGFIDDELDTEIRKFQKASGLAEDGQLTPGGETERNLISRISGEGMDVASPEDTVLRASVGDGGDNNPDDVAAVKRALGTLGYLKYDRTAPPLPYIDQRTVRALLDFQRDADLFPDGRADPEGETIKSLRELLEDNPAPRVDEEQRAKLWKRIWHLLDREPPGIAKPRRPNPQTVPKERTKTPEKSLHPPSSVLPLTPDAETNGGRQENIPPDPRKFGQGNTELPPEEPDHNDGKLEGRPATPVTDVPVGFPIPDDPENLIEISPGESTPPELPLIIERRGSESVRRLNALITRGFENAARECGLEVKHVGGSRDPDGAEIPETHLKNRDTGGRKGGNFVDITFEISGKRKIRYFINTVDTLADGTTLSARERRAAERILYNKEADAILHTFPKLGPNETIDLEALQERLEPLCHLLKEIVDGDADPESLEHWIKTDEKLPTK